MKCGFHFIRVFTFVRTTTVTLLLVASEMKWVFKQNWCSGPARVLCLRAVFRPLYLLLSLLGLFPYSIRSQDSSFRFYSIQKSMYLNATCALFYNLILFAFLAMHLRYIYLSIEISAMTAAIMTEMNYITELFNLTLFCVVAYISAYFHRHKYLTILNALALRIDPPNNNSEKVLTALRFQVVAVAMGWIGLTCVVQACVNFTRNDSTWKMFLVVFTFNLPQFIQFTNLAFFYVLIMMIVGVLRNIREQTVVIARENKIYVYGLINVDPNRRLLTLRQMEIIYIEMSELKRMVNHIFEAPILITLMQCFHSIVSESHIIYHGVVAQNNMELHEIINCSIWIVYQLMKVYSVARAGNALKLEVLKLGKAIHNIPTEKLDLRFMMEVQHFSSAITFYGNDLTAYGLFPLDATLTFKTVAAAAMYIIILVQFDKAK